MQVLSDEILQLVSTVSLTGWYDTAALRTTSYLFAFSHHRVAFLSQPVFYQTVTVTGRISGKWAHVHCANIIFTFYKTREGCPYPKVPVRSHEIVWMLTGSHMGERVAVWSRELSSFLFPRLPASSYVIRGTPSTPSLSLFICSREFPFVPADSRDFAEFPSSVIPR